MSKKRSRSDKRRAHLEELERRILLSADLESGLVDPSLGDGVDPNDPAVEAELLQQEEAGSHDAAVVRRELVLVDPGVQDHQALLADLQSADSQGRQLEVVLLDAERDGIQQISQILEGREDLDAIHIVSHGAEGAVQLGSTWLTRENLDAYQTAIAGWGDALSVKADLLFYGCDLAGGASGAAFAEALSGLTGADVAASTDATGSAILGGDWDLEYTGGPIETGVAFTTPTVADWNGLLSTIDTSFQQGADGYSGTLDTTTDEGAPNTNRGSQDYIAVDLNDGAGDETTQGLIRFDSIFGSGPGQIPFGSAIVSASLTVNVNDPSASGATVSLHQMLVSWDESSTWNSLSSGVSTNDVEAASSADAIVGSPATSGPVTITGLESTVQAWLDGASPNHGWVIVSDNTNGWDFDSSEAATVSQRPVLNVTYTFANEAPVNTVPGAQATPQDTSLVFSSAGGNAISIGDVDAGSNQVEVTLGVTNGTLALNLSAVPEAGETRVNATTTNSQGSADIDYAADGSFVVVWTSSAQDGDLGGIYAQRFDSSGVPQGSEFPVNTETADDQRAPQVAMDDAGNFVVVWESLSQDKNNTWGIYAQRYDALGVAQGGEFRVNTTTNGDQQSASVTMDADGDFVVVWSGNGSGDADGVFFQRYNASGAAQGSEVRVNTTTTDTQDRPAVAMDSSGNFAVVWESNLQDGSGSGIYGRLFNADGTARTGELLVNTTTNGNQTSPTVAMDDSGNFVAAWVGFDANLTGIFAQRFDSTGAQQGGQFQVNQTVFDMQSGPAAAMNAEGDFTISWHSSKQAPDFSGTTVIAREYLADGSAGSDELIVNSTHSGSQLAPSIAYADTGAMVIAWQGSGGGDADGVFLQRYQTPSLTFSVGDGTAAATMSFTGTVADINTALEGLTYTPNGGYNGVDTLTITTDDQGNTGTGGPLSDIDTVDITVGNPSAPVVDLSGADQAGNDFSTSWTEGAGPVAVADLDATLVDDDENLTQLAVTITNLLDGASEGLSANAGATGLSVSYDSGSGVLTISGAGTAAQYQQVLRSVRYDNTSDTPAATARVITFTPADSLSSGNTASTTLAMTATNDAPVNTVPGTQSTAQDTALVFSAGNANAISVADDSGGNDVEVTLSVNDGTLTLASLPAATEEAAANTTTDNTQNSAAIAVAPDGSHVVVWQSSGGQDGDLNGVYGQRFDANGQPIGGEFLVNATTAGSQQQPDVAISDSGSFVVIWESASQDGDGLGIFGQRFDASGGKLGGEFQVNTYTTSNQANAEIAMDGAGNFVVIWGSLDQDGSGEGVYKQSYAADGTTIGAETRVNATTANHQSYHSVDMNDSGEYVITWGSALQDGDSWGVYAQPFDAAGKVGGEFLVNTTTAGIQYRPDVAIDPSGNFVVAWDDQSALDGDGNGVFLQRFDATGATVGVETLVNTRTADNQMVPQLEMQDDGSFLVVWSGSETAAPSSYDIVGQLFDASGNRVGDETILSTASSGSQAGASIATNGTGTFAVAWSGKGAEDATGVYAQLFGDEHVTYSVGDGVADSTIKLRGTIAQINGLLEGMIYTPTSGFNGTDTLTVTTDDLGNTGSGGPLGDVDTVDINVGNANTPLVDLSGADQAGNDFATSWTEGGGAVLIVDGDASFIDGNDDPNQLTVTITNLLDGTNESLSADPGSTGLSVSYDSGSGVLTISGASTAVRYQEVLRTLRYENTAENPDTTARIITFTATDTISSGNTATTTLTIDATNDAPVHTVPGAQTTPQDTALVFSSGNGNAISVTDPDASIIEVTLTATNGTASLNLDGHVGPETRVNTTITDTQETPDIAVAADGSYVVAWASLNQDGSSWGVYAQRYDAGGTAVGGEIQVHSSETGDQIDPSVAIDDAGNFVVAWQTTHLGTGFSNVYAQRFDAGGNTIGGEFRVDAFAGANMQNPSIAMNGAGAFAIAFEAEGGFDGNGTGIYVRWYDAAGVSQGSSNVNITSAGDQTAPSVAMDDAGNFIVSWNSGDGGILFQRYDNAGKQGGEMQVTTAGYSSSVSADAAGNFVVVWQSVDSDSWGVFGRKFDPAGTELVSEFQVNTHETGDQVSPDVSMNGAGGFVVVWESYSQDAAGTYGVYGQRYDAAGNAVDSEFLINTTTDGSQRLPAVALADSGRFNVAWRGNGAGDDTGVFVKSYGLGLTFTAGDGADDATMTFTGSVVDVNTALEGLTFTPTTSYNGPASLRIQTSDLGQTGTGGTQTDDDTIEIAVGGSNIPSVLAGVEGTALSYAENDPATVITSALTVSDADDTHIEGATVQITGNYVNGEDLLAFTDTAGISSSWDAATGTLTLSGADTLANYRDALVAVTYRNTSDVPSTLSRTVSFTVDDGDGPSNTVTRDVDIASVNDAPTFSVGSGMSAINIGTSGDGARDLLEQPDGKLLVTGYGYVSDSYDFTLARYNEDGTLDTSFGTGGVVTTSFTANNDTGWSVALQSDGRIVVAGTDGNYDFALARYNSDGTLDASFGSGGKVTTSVGSFDSGNSVFVQGDGKIVVAGQSLNGSQYDVTVLRYNANGTLDSSFNGVGFVTTDFASGEDVGQAVSVLADGRIVVVGSSFNGSDRDVALLRYNADGSLDASFGSGGTVTTDFVSTDDVAISAVVRADGSILIAGYSVGTDNDFALAQYNADGSLDTSFGTGGKVTTAIGVGDDRAFDVALQADGKILVTGRSEMAASWDFSLLRYNSDGSLDGTFGVAGVVTTDFSGNDDYGYAVCAKADGTIVVAGDAAILSADFGLVRYNADGSLDTTFNPVNTLDGTPTYVEGTSPVVLDANVSVFDEELSPADNFSGAILTLGRSGSANAEDVFSATGSLSALTEGGNLVLSGITVGTVTTNSAGSLVVTFNGSATQARVDEVMRSIAYANSSDAPPAAVQVDWTFSDGNAGAQGSGGALTATGSTTVSIAAVNDDPTNAGSLPTDLVFLEDTQGKLDLSQIDLSDVDAGAGDLTLTISSANGHLQTMGWPGLVLGGSQSVLTLTGKLSDLNDFLDDVNSIDYEHATPNMSGDNVDLITIEITDNGNTGTGGGGTITLGTVNIDITPVSDAPVVTPGGEFRQYNEDAAPIIVDPSVTVSDADSPTLQGATVRISANYASDQDVLSFTDQSGISGSWEPATGVLTLSGAATVAQYQQALRSITYHNTSQDPITTARVVEFVVSDGVNNSDAVTKSISIVSWNDAPATDDVSAGGLEDAASIPITLTGSDVDGTVDRFRLSTLPPNGTLYTDAGLTTAAATGVDYAAAGESLTLYFVPAPDWSGVTTFEYAAKSADGGVDSSPATATITVTAVNDPPAAVGESFVTSEGVPFTATLAVNDLLLNDSDLEGDTLSVNTTPVTGPSNGTLVLNADGTFTYTPNANFNGTDSFVYEVTDGNGGSAQATATMTVHPREIRILFTTQSDVNNSKVPGIDSWDAGDVLGIGDPNLSFEPAGSDGSVLPYMDLEALSTSGDMTINGLHFVSNDITVGGANSVDLKRGDLLFVSDADDVMTSTNSLAITGGDVIVFRPDVVDDYSSGTFIHLLDQPGTAKTTGITLVENNVLVGDVTLTAGTFLFTQESVAEESSIYHFSADDVGSGTTTGTVSTLISSVDIDVNWNNFVGVMLITEDLYLDGAMVPKGSIVTTLAGGESFVGDNAIEVNEDEIFYLTVTSTTMGSGTTAADATILFDGGDIGLNSAQKKMRNLAIIEEVTVINNVDPVITLSAGALNYTEGDAPTLIDSAATLADPDSADFDGGLLRVDLGTTGSVDDRLAIHHEGNAAGQIGISGTTVRYGGVDIGTFAGGTDGSDPLTVALNEDADVAAVQAVIRNVTFENVSSTPSTTQRSAKFAITDGDGGVSGVVAKTIVINDVNTAPVLTGANDLNAIDEDAFSNGGTLVSGLISGWVADADPDALSGIAVVGVDNTNGSWEFSIDGGSAWTAFGSPSTGAARLLAANPGTFVRFVPVANWNGAVTDGITFHAWDQSDGVSGDVVDLFAAGNLRDQFDTVSYANNDGSAVWTSDWVEFDDDGSAASGNIRVEGGKLRLDSLDGGVKENVTRSADLSDAVSATLTFDYDAFAEGGLDIVAFEVSNNGGSTWTVLESMELIGSISGSKSFDLQSFTTLTADMQVRFRIVQGLAGTTQHINFDNVDIAYVGTGSGGSSSVSVATASSSIVVNAVNDPPANAVPGTQTVVEETPTAIPGISIGDVDAAAGNLTTQLQVSNGVLNVTLGGSATISAGSNGTNDLTIQGTVADINATLASLIYTGNTDVSGTAADSLTVTTSDGGNTGAGGALQDTDSIQIDITPVNDPPTVSLQNTVTLLSENIDTTARIKVADIVVSDDGEGTNVLGLTGADASLFEIDGTELYLKAGASLDFETNPVLDVTVEVDDAALPATPEDSAALAIDVTDVNQAPTVTLQNTTTSFPEDTDTTARIKVADIVVSDDGEGTNVLSLTGADASLFEIDGTELYLRAGASLDFETNPVLDVVVEVDDAALPATPEDSAALAIDVTDVNQAPTVTLQNTTTSFPEDTDTTARIKVADIVVGDDGEGTNVLSLTGADSALFEIDGTELYLSAGATLDFETNSVLDVTVEVDDAALPATPEDSAALAIDVTDVNQAPTVTLQNTTTSFPEDTDTTARIKVADIVVGDDGEGTNVLSLSGTDSALFEIDGTELYLSAGASLDFETNSVLDVTVEVDDAALPATPEDSAALAIDVTDVNQAPTVTLQNTTTSFPEDTDTTARIKVADIVVGDDGEGTNVLSLTGADSALFEIDSGVLYLKAGASLDFETNPVLDVTVEVDDAALPATPEDSAALAIDVTDVNQAPTVTLQNTTTSFPEDTDTTARIKVADIVVGDDGEGTNVLSLSGTDSALFEIDGTELYLSAGATLDFETNSVLDVTVEVDDAALPAIPEDSAALAIDVTDVNQAPTVALQNTTTSFPEDTDTTARIKVADIVVGDDGEGTNVLSLTGADAGLFEIDGTELYLKAGASLDFETNPVLDVTVEVDDAALPATPEDSAALVINVTDVNQAPTVTLQNTTTSFPEDTDTTARIKVADIVVGDDGEGTNVLSLSGTDSALFEIDSGVLYLKAGASLDFETNPVLDVTVEVDDAALPATPEDSAALAITVTDANEAPTVTLQNATTTFAEDTDTTARIKVADIVVADDALGTNVLSLSGADAGLFEIDGTELYLSAGASLDFETNPVLDVTVEVDDAALPATPEDSAALAITVTDANEAPTVTLQNTTTTFPEDTDTTARIKVADIVVADDALGTNVLSLTGTDAGLFEIDGTELYLSAGASLDFETNPVLDVTVEVDDAALPATPEDSAALAINVTDVNEAPTVSLQNTTTTFLEDTDTTARIKVADIVVADDGVGTNVLSLSGADAGLFEIDGTELYLSAGASLDFETNPVLDVTVEVDDAALPATPEDSAALAINVTDANEAPTVTLQNATTTFAEDTDTTARIKVADIVVADDALGTNVLSLSGTDAGLFEIDGTELYLSAGASLDFETNPVLDVTVEVDDAALPATPEDSAALAINVTDVNEAPTVSLQNTTTTFLEDTDTTARIKVADIVVADDALGTNVLSLSGTDSALFEIDGTELYLSAGASLDFETNPVLDVTVEVDDAALPATPEDSAALAITVTDANEAPTVALQNATTTFPEATDTTARIKVADIVVADDALGTNVLSPCGADSALFEIDGTELYLKAGSALDFETNPVLDVTVEVDDAALPATPEDSAALAINVTDANEAPTVSLQNTTTTFAEDTDTTVRIKVADIVVADDALGTNVLSLSGADAGLFEIDGTELYLSAGASLDFETNPVLDVTVEVDDAALPATPEDSAALAITVTDANEAPTVSLQNTTTTFSEDTDTTVRIKVADIVVADDAIGTNVLSLSGADAGLFEIDGTELYLSAGASLDFETNPVLDVTVEVDDAALPATPEDSAALAITVTDANEAPTVTLQNATTTFPEATDTTARIKVADIVVADDALGTNVLSLTGTDAGLFEIDGTELYLKAGSALDFETNPVLDVTVEVDDAALPATPEDSAALAITVTDANEAPTVSLANVTTTFPEDTDTTARIKVADIVVADDALGTNVLSLSGTDSALFEIDGTELYLSAGASLDFETNPVLDVTVEVDDAALPATPEDSAALAITVTDANEAPTVALQNATTTFPEATDTTARIKVADIVVADDALGTNVLSLTGTDAGLFEIDGTELYLKAGSALDFETNPVLDVTVEVDDAALPATPEDSAALAITVTDANEAPTVSLANVTTTFPEDTDTTARIKVADIVVADDALGTNVLSLTGTDAGLFEIDGTELYLSAGSSLDFETNPVLDMTVEVDDAALPATPEDSAALAITVTDANEAPTVALQNTTTTFAEDTDTTARIKVADIVVADDALGTNVLSLIGADAALFEIDGTELYLKAATALDFEANPVLDVTVEVDDAALPATPEDSAALAITVTDANEAPTVALQNATTTFPEDTDTTARIKVADIVVADDALGTNVLSLSGTDSALFEIDGTELYLSAGASLDFETNPVLDVTVEVDDAALPATPEDSAALAITVTDANEAPTVALQNATTTFPEDTDTTARIKVADIVVADDALGTNVLSLSGTDSALFEIDGTELYLSAGASLDFETNPVLDVTVEVDDAALPATPEDSAALAINVTDANEAPTVSLQNTTTTFAEDTDTTVRIKVADIVVADDALGTNVLSLSGADAGLFEIDGTELYLKAGSALDFETNPVLDVTVEVDDAALPATPEDSAALAITVTDANEAPTVGDDTFDVAENSANGTVVGTVTANDPDAADTLSYAITGGDPGGALAIDAATGEITVADETQLDRETTPGFNLTVTVTDTDGLTDTAAVTVNLIDVNEAPTVSDAAFSLAENSANGTAVGTVAASDPEVGDTLSYAITGGDPGEAFTIDAATGEITVNDPTHLDFETAPVSNLTVTVTDVRGLMDMADVTVSLTNANEAPTASDSAFSVAEDSANGTVVGGVSASDPDAGDTLSYAITGGDPGGALRIDAATGEITVADASQLDFETSPVLNLAVTVTDAGGLTDTRIVPISVQPGEEPPVIDSSELPPANEDEDPAPTDDSDDTDSETTEEAAETEEESAEQSTTETDVSVEESELRLGVTGQVRWNPVSFSPPAVEVPTSHEDSGSQRLIHEVLRNPHSPTEHTVAAEGRLAIVRTQQMMQVLDQIRQEMADDAAQVAGEHETIVSTAEEVALAFSAGLLGILMRGSSLAAVALSALPVWRRVDPLAILALSDEERRKREEELRSARETEDLREEAVGRLLDEDEPRTR